MPPIWGQFIQPINMLILGMVYGIGFATFMIIYGDFNQQQWYKSTYIMI